MHDENYIRQRYFRKVMGHPEGAVVHHGDCQVWRVGICTCGLLHDLQPMDWEVARQLYPNFTDELARQDKNIEDLFNRTVY